MTLTRINYSQVYVQDEHQRTQQQIIDAINSLQTQLSAIQAAIIVINKQLGIT